MVSETKRSTFVIFLVDYLYYLYIDCGEGPLHPGMGIVVF